MKRNYPNIEWCRYADDGLVHCRTEAQAQLLSTELGKRFKECGLDLHPDKTHIVYCKDDKRKSNYKNTAFEFLGYYFNRRKVKNNNCDLVFVGFTPAVSPDSLKSMRAKTRKLGIRNRTDLSIEEIAEKVNPILRGWLTYYGKYSRSGMYPVLRHFNLTLISWAMRKYKRFRGHKTKAARFIQRIACQQPLLFEHWKQGMVGEFA